MNNPDLNRLVERIENAITAIVDATAAIGEFDKKLSSAMSWAGLLRVLILVGVLGLVVLFVVMFLDVSGELHLLIRRVAIVLVTFGIVVILIAAVTRVLGAASSTRPDPTTAAVEFWVVLQELAKNVPLAVVGLLLVWMGLVALGVDVADPTHPTAGIDN